MMLLFYDLVSNGLKSKTHKTCNRFFYSCETNHFGKIHTHTVKIIFPSQCIIMSQEGQGR